MPERRSLRRAVRQWEKDAGRWVGHRLGAPTIRALSRTWRTTSIHEEVRESVEERYGSAIIAMWHGRAMLGLSDIGSRTVTILVSASEDGSMATHILEKLGYPIVRGSTSQHGTRALREMRVRLQEGGHVVITPDGPRGPMHSMGPGVAFLARVSGRPVLPVGFACDRAWRLDNWDRTTIPKPRSRVVRCWRPPILVPRDASTRRIAEVSTRIRDEIRAAEREAFAELSLEPDWGEVPEWAPDWI